MGTGVRRRLGSARRAWRDGGDVSRPRLVTGPLRMRPAFLVIGAAKAGTTSLFFALARHPLVRPPVEKELNYFTFNYGKGPDWYRAHFPWTAWSPSRPHPITGEATPYYLFHPHVPRRVADTLPGARVVALLRDPVDRAYSHFQHNRRDGKEDLSFEDAVAREEERVAAGFARMEADEWFHSGDTQAYSYLARGRYAEQLERWYRHVPRERVLVLRSEDLYADPPAVVRRVSAFLGLPDWEPQHDLRLNVGTYRDPLPEATRRRLAEHFVPHNERLRELVGPELRWPSDDLVGA